MNQPTKAEQEAKAARERHADAQAREQKAAAERKASGAREDDRQKTHEVEPQSGRGGTPGGPGPRTDQQVQADVAHANRPLSPDSNANEQHRQAAMAAAGAPGTRAPAVPLPSVDAQATSAHGLQRTEAQIANARTAYEAGQEAAVKMADAHRANEDAARAADTEKNERDHEVAKGVVEGAIAQGQSITSGQVPQQNPVVQAALAKLNQPAGGPLRADDVFPDAETVQMLIPVKGVTLTLDGGQKVYFPGGLQNVPRQLADHWYMKAHGVKPHNGPSPRPARAGVATRG